MLDECLRIFKQELKDNTNLVLNTIILADGDYVLVHDDGTYDVEKIKYSKKDHCFIEKPEDDLYEKLCFYDYQSQVIDTQKTFDLPHKLILSNNYLSYFVKKEKLNNKKKINDATEKYFLALSNPRAKYNGKDLEMYNFVTQNISEVDKRRLLQNKQWLKQYIYNLDGVDYNEKDYLKIFFEADYHQYINEGNRYLLTKIFYCNDYNTYENETVYGVPNYNMQLNSNKPFLKNMTRMHKVPFKLSLEEALIQKQFFDYLLNYANKGKTNIYISSNENDTKRIYFLDNTKKIKKGFNGLYLKIKKDKELKIEYIDTVTDYKEYLSPMFNFRNVIGAFDDEYYQEYNKRNEVEKLLNDVLFSKFLINNYFTDPDSIISIKGENIDVYKKNLITCREAIFAWIHVGAVGNIKNILPKAALETTIHSIKMGHIKLAQRQFNLYFAINEYFNKQENGMKDLRESIRTKINSQQQMKIENDLEYSFAVGQAIAYLQSKSKAKNKTQDFINQFITIKRDDSMKSKLKNLYLHYNYALSTGKTRFNMLFGMIMEYQSDQKINQNMLIAGYIGENLIYEKGENENG